MSAILDKIADAVAALASRAAAALARLRLRAKLLGEPKLVPVPVRIPTSDPERIRHHDRP